MPTLRFSRDGRGYESTYLVHTSGRRSGPESSQLLYWFRSPPHVKVGRAAFDEDTIRALEEQHPDVEFDWDRILTAKAPEAPELRDLRDARPARRPDRRLVKDVRREPPRPASAVPMRAPAATTPLPEGSESAPLPPVFSAAETVAPPVAQAAPTAVAAEPVEPAAVDGPAPRRFVRVFDAPPPLVEELPHRAMEPSVVEQMLGAEQLTVLRARYAEILARISARGGDPVRVEALRDRAAAVDPDAWVTEPEVTAGLALVEPTLAELHQIAGRRRRRRRRRRDAAPPTSVPVSPQEASDLGAQSVPDADDPESDDVDDEPDGA